MVGEDGMKPVLSFLGEGELARVSERAAAQKGFCSTAVRHADIVYVAPDRPDKNPQHFVDYALENMRKDAILVVHCQVEPGFTRKIDWPFVYYHVETLRLKDAKERALNPERIILGCHHAAKIGHFVNEALIDFLDCFTCPILTMSYESAELAKIAINVYLAAQIDTTATLSKVARSLGANWDDIIPALQTDKRIGQHAYLQPGNGYGPHIQRDIDWLSRTLTNPHAQ
jgi:UDPglucose 6-dehydrogenase